MFYEAGTIDFIRRSMALDSILIPVGSRHHGKRGRYQCPVCKRNDGGTYFAKGKEYTPGQKYCDQARMFKCHYCGFSGDIVRLYAAIHGVGRNEAIQMVLADFGDRLGELGNPLPAQSVITEVAQQPKADFTEYVKTCMAALIPGSMGWKYLVKRGFSNGDITTLRDVFHVGFDAACTGHGSLKWSNPAIVMPYSDDCSYYAARFCEGSIKFTRPSGVQVSEPFQAKQLHSGKTAVFIVESELDALTILTTAHFSKFNIGAVATGGCENLEPIIRHLKNSPTDARLIIAGDNDAPGQTGGMKLAAALREIGQSYERWNPILTVGRCRDQGGKPCKDPNEVLALHGHRILAGILDAVVKNSQIFCMNS